MLANHTKKYLTPECEGIEAYVNSVFCTSLEPGEIESVEYEDWVI